MIHTLRTRKRIRSLPTATQPPYVVYPLRPLPEATLKVNASRFAWQTMHLRMKAAA